MGTPEFEDHEQKAKEEPSYIDGLTRKQRRAFQRKLQKPKYRKIAQRIIDKAEAKNEPKETK